MPLLRKLRNSAPRVSRRSTKSPGRTSRVITSSSETGSALTYSLTLSPPASLGTLPNCGLWESDGNELSKKKRRKKWAERVASARQLMAREDPACRACHSGENRCTCTTAGQWRGRTHVSSHAFLNPHTLISHDTHFSVRYARVRHPTCRRYPHERFAAHNTWHHFFDR